MKDNKVSMSSDDIIKLFGRPGEKEVQLARCEMTLEREREKREELEKENGDLRYRNSELEKENTELSRMLRNSQVQLLYLHNLIVLSSDRVRQFAETVKDIESWAMLRTMLTFCLHQDWRQEGEQQIEEVMGLPKTAPQVVISQVTGDCVVEKNVYNEKAEAGKEEP
ncbi:MAG: hypothetical protein J5661_06500 [Bacteroidaceae bacterium]|nr:hypothetical protein [Bacteroidaceae bacterium]